MCESSKVFPSAVESQLPDIDVSAASLASKLLTLTVRLDGCVKPVRKNFLDLVICSWRFGKVRHLACFQINSHYRRTTLGFVTGERHLGIVVVEILRLEDTISVLTFIDRLPAGQFGDAGNIQVRHHQSRGFRCEIRGLCSDLRKRNLQSLLGNCGTLAHFLIQPNRACSRLLAQEPEFVVAYATSVDVLEMIWTNQNVVSGHEMHHSEKGGARHVASQALHDS